MEDRRAVKGPAARASAGRWALIAGGGVLALLLVWAWPRRPQPPAAEPVLLPAPTESSSVRPAAAPRPDAPVAEAQPEVDPYGMPPPSPDQIKPRPEQRAPTPAEQLQTQQAAVALVESSITRLESEGRRAEQAGDTETARRNQIRVERLRKRLGILKQEAAP